MTLLPRQMKDEKTNCGQTWRPQTLWSLRPLQAKQWLGVCCWRLWPLRWRWQRKRGRFHRMPAQQGWLTQTFISIYVLTGWLEEFSWSLSHQNYTFCIQKILLVSLRHPRSLGFQLCMPIFHIHLCTVGQFVFTWPKIWNCPQGQTKPNKIFIFINFNPG